MSLSSRLTSLILEAPHNLHRTHAVYVIMLVCRPNELRPKAPALRHAAPVGSADDSGASAGPHDYRYSEIAVGTKSRERTAGLTVATKSGALTQTSHKQLWLLSPVLLSAAPGVVLHACYPSS